MTMLWSLPIRGASFLAAATAWADSMAGMMPSVFDRYSNGAHRFLVGDVHIVRPAGFKEMGVLRADAG